LLRAIADKFDVPLALFLAWEEKEATEAGVLSELKALYIKLLEARLARASGGGSQ
jgi:hypothetical protein